MNPVYIHYGATVFNPEKGFPITNEQRWSKPNGGLWASRVEATYGWKQWCKDNDFRKCLEEDSFQFQMKDPKKVKMISSLSDLRRLPQLENPYGIFNEVDIDFERCVDIGIDGIELCWYGEEWKYKAKDDMYMALYGWDCDSIVVLNPNAVEVVSHNIPSL